GSAGVDVTTVRDATLWDTHIHRIPLNVKGPIGNGCSALLLGRSSTTMAGLLILPGVIDADCEGQIQAMAWRTPSPPLSIPKGTRIAQLISFKAIVPKAMDNIRGSSGFGSAGAPAIFWSTNITQHRTTLTVTLFNNSNQPLHIRCKTLLDTGADITVIA
ncbi:hypothetical protein N339_00027, partial [Pterocles gutturalis]